MAQQKKKKTRGKTVRQKSRNKRKLRERRRGAPVNEVPSGRSLVSARKRSPSR